MWWSTFIHRPHNVKHVIQAVFRYFQDSSYPQFIAGQLGMPNGVVLVHFATEPGFHTNYLILEYPTLNTGIKLIHDLDLAKCRLQLQEGKGPDYHTGHRCAIKGLGHPGQGVPGSATFPVILTKEEEPDHQVGFGTISGRLGERPRLSAVDVGGFINDKKCFPASGIASTGLMATGGSHSVSPRANELKEEAHGVSAGPVIPGHDRAQGVRTSLTVGESEQMSAEGPHLHPDVSEPVQSASTISARPAETIALAESMVSMESERPSNATMAKIEKLIDEVRDRGNRETNTSLSQQSRKLNATVQSQSHTRDKSGQSYLTFTDIEDQDTGSHQRLSVS